jgi:Ca2+-binding EF-hand superfamily protein
MMRGGPRGAGQLAQPDRFIERLDTDADGQVSAAEFSEERLQRIDDMFEHRDTNGDGLISLEEHDAPRVGRGPMRADRRERMREARPEIDRDALTACVRETIADYEPRFDEPMDDVFADLDTNGDNMLSLTEVTAALEARALAAFGRIDGDSNGFITEAEVTTHFEAQRAVGLAVRDCARELHDAAN